MKLNRPVGSIKSVGYASVFINDFAQYRDKNMPGSNWGLWQNVATLQRSQILLMDLHADALKAVEKVRENADLTREAKTRRSREIFNSFVEGARTVLPEIAKTAENFYAFASEKLTAVQALAANDTVQAGLDAECRAYVRSLNAAEQASLIGEIRQGNEPRIAAVILRGPARVSGLKNIQLTVLGAAGIAVAHGEAVITLAKFAIGIREVQMLARGLGGDIIRAGVGIESLTAEIEPWVKPSPALESLFAWLEPIPLELPGKITSEMAKRAKQAEPEEAA